MNPSQVRLMASLETRHWWYQSTHQLVLDALLLFSDRSARLLDVGCGTGGLLRHLGGFSSRTGLDLDPLALGFARRRESHGSRGEFVLGDIEALPRLEMAPFDCMTCIDVLYHRQVADWMEAIASMASKLRAGGVLVLQVPAWNCLSGAHDRAVDGVRRFRRAPVEDVLRKSGFEILLSSYRFSWLFPGMLVLRGGGRLRKGPAWGANDLRRCTCLPRFLRKAVQESFFRLALLENDWLLGGGLVPVGSSLFVVARKARSSEWPGRDGEFREMMN